MKLKAKINGKTKTFTLNGDVTEDNVFATIKRELKLYAPIMQISLPATNSPLYVEIWDEMCDNVVGTVVEA